MERIAETAAHEGPVVTDANAANGMTRDADGRLVVCEQGTAHRPIDLPGAVNLWIEADRIYITADTAIWAAERSTT